jgi:hypothetical protein
MIKATGLVDVVNNVIFIPRTIATVVDGELGSCHVNLVGNMVIAPNGDGLVHGVRVLGQRPVSLFVEGNLGPYRKSSESPDFVFVAAQSRRWIIKERTDAPPVTTFPAEEVYEKVLANAGCLLPVRDAVDERVISDVKALKTRILTDPLEVGGWPELPQGTPPKDSDHDGLPDDWERLHNFDPKDPKDSPMDADGDGYTNLEEFLNQTAPRPK